jgi:hypothetical protein
MRQPTSPVWSLRGKSLEDSGVSANRFRIHAVFDVPTRVGLLVVVGTFIDAQPVGVPPLPDGTTGHVLNLLGVEFATARTLETSQTTLCA